MTSTVAIVMTMFYKSHYPRQLPADGCTLGIVVMISPRLSGLPSGFGLQWQGKLRMHLSTAPAYSPGLGCSGRVLRGRSHGGVYAAMQRRLLHKGPTIDSAEDVGLHELERSRWSWCSAVSKRKKKHSESATDCFGSRPCDPAFDLRTSCKTHATTPPTPNPQPQT